MTPPSPFAPFLCISASAGTGKTFALAHRVLRLLAMGVAPDKIGAYTFSRKAAGEIFDEIVRYLREAAENAQKAAATSANMGFPQDSSGFLANLRALLANLHRLRIGTLDSRIAQMLSAAAIELQLPSEFAMLDGQGPEARFLHEQVLDELFRPGHLDPEAERAFLHAFEEATHGENEKAFDRKLLAFAHDHRAVFLITPGAEAWNHPGPLPLRDPAMAVADSDRDRLAESLLESLARIDNARLADALEKLILACAGYGPGKSWSKEKVLSGKLAPQFLAGEEGSITYYNKTIPIPTSLWQGLRLLLRHPLGVELERAFTQTRGLHQVLHIFENRYRQTAFPRGRISFEDASALMAEFHLLSPGELAFRLDGEVEHWLLDEFQDTSTLQWRALEPFVDEVLQDPEHRRSFFYVGDVKQAIYAWRGGNADLFGEILKTYPLIQEEMLDVSQRSAPPVLDLVNHLLHGIPDFEKFPPAAVRRWNDDYRPHAPAPRNLRLPGHARVLELGGDEEEADLDVLADILRGIDPGLETAILVRSNSQGAELADGLRGRGIQVALEGQSALRKDTAVEAILAALTLAAHPADSFSRRLLEMADLAVEPIGLLRALHRQGFAATVRDLIQSLPLSDTSAYARGRLDKLATAAEEFDALRMPSIDRFIAFADGYFLKEHESKGVVRIMTIHQSKGLGFDAVLFPVGKSSNFVKADGHQLSTSATGAEPAWVLDFPPKEVCQYSPGLDTEYERLEAESAYENLCNLYVALTRAKQGLYVILPAASKTEGSMRVMHNWIRKRLEGAPIAGKMPPITGAETIAAWGDPGLTAPKAKPSAPIHLAPFPLSSGTPVAPRLEPSREDARARELGRAFQRIAEDGRELGSRVHAILENVEWADGLTADALLAACGEPADSPAAAHVRRALAFGAMEKPVGASDLWREQRFETVLEDGWITGIFDRVVVFPDAAWIQDFKTNKQSDDATVGHYVPQMRLYRKVLADMLGLDPAKIRCQLLFTNTGELREIP